MYLVVIVTVVVRVPKLPSAKLTASALRATLIILPASLWIAVKYTLSIDLFFSLCFLPQMTNGLCCQCEKGHAIDCYKCSTVLKLNICLSFSIFHCTIYTWLTWFCASNLRPRGREFNSLSEQGCV